MYMYLGQCPHERLVVLHATCRVHQYNIKPLLMCVVDGLHSNASCIFPIPPFIQHYLERERREGGREGGEINRQRDKTGRQRDTKVHQ